MREELLDLLNQKYPDIDFESTDQLITEGKLDSLTMIGIISLITEKFKLEIPFEDISEENFNSVDSMVKMISKIKHL